MSEQKVWEKEREMAREARQVEAGGALDAQLDDESQAATRSPPYPFCCHPEKCIPTGRCERRVGGELWCCAD